MANCIAMIGLKKRCTSQNVAKMGLINISFDHMHLDIEILEINSASMVALILFWVPFAWAKWG